MGYGAISVFRPHIPAKVATRPTLKATAFRTFGFLTENSWNVFGHGGDIHLLLSLDDVREFSVGDSWIELALHQSSPLVILNIAQVAALWYLNIFGEALSKHKVTAEAVTKRRE